MIFINKTEDYNGTSLQGYITTTLSELIEVLGQPHTNDDKTTAEWAFKTLEGVVFTIYDYKNDSVPTKSYSWHIGGLDKKAVQVVQQIFPDNYVEGK